MCFPEGPEQHVVPYEHVVGRLNQHLFCGAPALDAETTSPLFADGKRRQGRTHSKALRAIRSNISFWLAVAIGALFLLHLKESIRSFHINGRRVLRRSSDNPGLIGVPTG